MEKKPLVFLSNGNNYGTLGLNSGATNAPKSIIYCVHGKPSAGCCKVMESENSADFNNKPIIKENSNATILVNKHCHRSKIPEMDKKARRKLIIASILCVIFMIGEVIGGYISNSLAIASDAAHLLTDFASFMISLFSIWMANRPSTRKMSFGWYRAEVIGALTSVLLIWIVTGVLVYLAVGRVVEKTFDIDAKIMLITSGVGVLLNLIIAAQLKSPSQFEIIVHLYYRLYRMGLTLHQHGHTHGSNAHSHSHKHHSGTGVNINVRAAFIHVIGDFLQSFGVFVAALVIYFKKDWILIDPICTFIFSVLVLITTFAIIKDALTVLMEGLPKGIDFNEVMNILLNIDGVKRVHNLRIWALSLDKIAMSAHVAIKTDVNPQTILMVATKNIHDRFSFFEMTLQIEEFQDIMEGCNQCKNPV